MASTSSTDQRSALETAGWVHIPAVLSAAEVADVVTACEGLLGEPRERWRRGDRPGAGTRHLMELDTRVPLVADLLERDAVLGAVEMILGGERRVDQVSFRCPQPGHGGQDLHADDVPKLDQLPARVATAIVALVSFTAENGATRVVPGSHRRVDLQRRSGGLSSHPGERTLTCAAGDALVFSGHLLHGGTPNRSAEERPALQITWRTTPPF